MSINGIVGSIAASRRRKRIKRFIENVAKAESDFEEFLRAFNFDAQDYKLFAVLGIRPTDNQKAIKDAYRGIVKRYHPDISRSPNADAITKATNEAYAILSKRSSGMHASEKSNAAFMNVLIDAYSVQLKKDYETLKGALSHGPVEKWFYMQEIENFLDYKKRAGTVFSKMFNNFYRLGKRTHKLYAEGMHLSKSGDGEDSLEAAVGEIKYIDSACARVGKDIKTIKEEFYKYAQENSKELRKKFAQ